MKHMQFLLFLSLMLTSSLSVFAVTPPEEQDEGEEEVARTI